MIGEKHIGSMNFGEYLRKSDVSENRKFILAYFYEMDFMKGIVILVKVDEMYNIIKSLLASRYCSRDKCGIV